VITNFYVNRIMLVEIEVDMNVETIKLLAIYIL